MQLKFSSLKEIDQEKQENKMLGAAIAITITDKQTNGQTTVCSYIELF